MTHREQLRAMLERHLERPLTAEQADEFALYAVEHAIASTEPNFRQVVEEVAARRAAAPAPPPDPTPPS